MFKIGDLVTRKSYHNDLVFRINDINDDIYILSGINIRLCADAPIDDLVKYDQDIDREEEYINDIKLERDDYFYLPGKILHIDSDNDYLERCLNYYKKVNIWARGVLKKEYELQKSIYELLDEYKPDIVVITGHDAYYKKKGNINDLNSYKNSSNFIEAVKEARLYEKEHDKLIIIAGACQSNYEELIKAGANFASSPKRINIHALDPAIIATKVSLSLASKDIDLKSILGNTKYGPSGIGGIITKGTMYVGYPR